VVALGGVQAWIGPLTLLCTGFYNEFHSIIPPHGSRIITLTGAPSAGLPIGDERQAAPDGRLPKVLLVTVRADLGGGPEHILQLVRGLKDRVEFHCALPRQEPFFRKMKEEGLRLVELPVRKFGVGPLCRLREYVQTNEISIIHSHGRGAGFYSRGLRMMSSGTAAVHTFHGIHWKSWSPTNLVERGLSRLTDVAICVSSCRATG
jgi:hypothetical protein